MALLIRRVLTSSNVHTAWLQDCQQWILSVNKRNLNSSIKSELLCKRSNGPTFGLCSANTWRTFSSICKKASLTYHPKVGESCLLLCGWKAGAVNMRRALGQRMMSMEGKNSAAKANQSLMLYVCATGVFMLGLSYAAVPLYRMFCQATGRGGQAVQGHDVSMVEMMRPVKDRRIHVRFNADTPSSMQWNFRPQQAEVVVAPGETALAFYRAKNPSNRTIIGISTYNVVPFEAGQYFNKIQCFCFEEQMLKPHEEVDMPVFFFIDPEYAEDPNLATMDHIELSYTFFEAKEGMSLPLPGFMQQKPAAQPAAQ